MHILLAYLPTYMYTHMHTNSNVQRKKMKAEGIENKGKHEERKEQKLFSDIIRH